MNTPKIFVTTHDVDLDTLDHPFICYRNAPGESCPEWTMEVLCLKGGEYYYMGIVNSVEEAQELIDREAA